MSRFFVADRVSSGTGAKFITHDQRLTETKNELGAAFDAIRKDEDYQSIILDYDHGINKCQLPQPIISSLFLINNYLCIFYLLKVRLEPFKLKIVMCIMF